MPDSNLFTLFTSLACSCDSIFLWIIPRPPICAILIAKFDSVTVSIAAEIKGILRLIDFVILVETLVSDGLTDDFEGTIRTSSNVKASIKFFIK